MIYTIQKGSHRSTWLPKFTLSTSIGFSFKFLCDPSYILDNKSDQEDTNKIFGISDSWYHRRHSVRVGWRYDDKLQKSILCVYSYRDGEHYVEDLGEIEQDVDTYIRIKINKNYYKVDTLEAPFFSIPKKTIVVPRTSKWCGPRYQLFPYFGGQQVAPKQFKIEIIKK
jgi:hypothetical protein